MVATTLTVISSRRTSRIQKPVILVATLKTLTKFLTFTWLFKRMLKYGTIVCYARARATEVSLDA
jgi:hypothetical protein